MIRKKTKELLVVISSPSGGGKTTITKMILQRNPGFLYSVSATTRSKRENEKAAIDYFFVPEEEFKKRIKREEFAEWAKVHNHYYGTLKKFIQKAKQKGKTLLFDIDVQGGIALKNKFPQSVLIFILPPSFKELKKRLRKRGTESKPEMQTRLQTALNEFKFWSKYDYVVINHKSEEAAKEVEAIILAERLRSKNYMKK
jgi:guanylate kinase